MQLEILYEDNHLIVVNKPAGWVTQGALPGVPSLYDAVCDYLKEKYHKPGNVYLGVVSRLDAPVSGVICFARTSKAAARLNEQFHLHTTQKRYLAVVESAIVSAAFTAASSTQPVRTAGVPSVEFATMAHATMEPAIAARLPAVSQVTSGICEDWLYHDDRACRVRVVPKGTDGAKSASLAWYCVAADVRTQQALLEIDLHTGRKHQIRVQLASRGMPIMGDPLYGPRNRPANRQIERNALYGGRLSDYDRDRPRSEERLRIALHASRLVLEHPVRHEMLTFEAPMPAYFFPWKTSSIGQPRGERR